MSLCFLAALAWVQKSCLVGHFVGLQVLPVAPDVGPGPHGGQASYMDLQDAVEGVPPPEQGKEIKHTLRR